MGRRFSSLKWDACDAGPTTGGHVGRIPAQATNMKIQQYQYVTWLVDLDSNQD
jgi:hypothetical protein